MSIKCPSGDNQGAVGFVSLELREEVWTGDQDLADLKIMGLDDITQRVRADKEEKSVFLRKLFLDNSQV